MAKSRLYIRPNLPDAFVLMRALGVDKDGRVQASLDRAIARDLPLVMPRRTGDLALRVKLIGPCRIRVDGPETRFLFFGKTAKGEEVNYYKGANPNAGPNWDRRLCAIRGKAIAAELLELVRRRK